MKRFGFLLVGMLLAFSVQGQIINPGGGSGVAVDLPLDQRPAEDSVNLNTNLLDNVQALRFFGPNKVTLAQNLVDPETGIELTYSLDGSETNTATVKLIADAPSDGNQYVRKDDAWEVVAAAAASGGGSTARVIPVDNFYLNQAVRPDLIPLQDGSGDVLDFYKWDFEDVDRLDPIRVQVSEAGTYNPVFSGVPPFVTNAVSQTNAILIGYCNDSPIATSAVWDVSSYTIDNYDTNGVVAATGSVTLATGECLLDCRWDSVGGTNGFLFSSDLNIDLGSAQ